MTTTESSRLALVTGGSAGLGLALVKALSVRDWDVLTDARDPAPLAAATAPLPRVTALPGDVGDARHQDDLASEVRRRGRLDLLVHNASALGPMLPLAEVTADQLADVLATNLLAPLALTRKLLPELRLAGGVLVGISSDAAVEHYPAWGTYAASKAALDHLVLTLGAENGLDAYAIDPGDMRTALHQQAFPGEDISDRPRPESVVGRVLAIATVGRPSGRYRVVDEPAPVLETVR